MDYHRYENKGKPFRGQHIVDPDGLIFIAESEWKFKNWRPKPRKNQAWCGVHATWIRKHIHDYSQYKCGGKQRWPIAIDGKKYYKQNIRKWADEAKKRHIIENDDLCRNKQDKPDDIKQYAAIQLVIGFPGL